MATKKKARKKAVAKVPVTAPQGDRKVAFAGAQRILVKPQTPKEQHERDLIMLVSRALEIHPFGINLLGGLPYTNNMGRKDKMAQYESKAQFEYQWVQRALTDADKAICEARIVVGNKALCGWVVGECSPMTIKMKPLQGYQNHMAQTRAENRAFEAAFGARMRFDLFEGIQRVLSLGATTEAIAAKALSAGTTSAEEAVDGVSSQTYMQQPAQNTTAVTPEDMQRVRAIIKSTGSIQALIDIDEKVQGSKRYTKAQKIEIRKLTTERGHEIDGK